MYFITQRANFSILIGQWRVLTFCTLLWTSDHMTVSPIIRCAPQAPAAILSSIESAYLLSDICNPCSNQAIDCFLSQKHSTMSLAIPSGEHVFSGVYFEQFNLIASPDVNKNKEWLRTAPLRMHFIICSELWRLPELLGMWLPFNLLTRHYWWLVLSCSFLFQFVTVVLSSVCIVIYVRWSVGLYLLVKEIQLEKLDMVYDVSNQAHLNQVSKVDWLDNKRSIK